MARKPLNVEELGKALAKVMDEMVSQSGVSGRALSVEVDITRARFSQLLLGERPPTVDELDRFAKRFGTKASELIREAERSLHSELAEVRDLSELRARVESGQEVDAAALQPGYAPEEEHGPEST